jgi:hypothetical protein
VYGGRALVVDDDPADRAAAAAATGQGCTGKLSSVDDLPVARKARPIVGVAVPKPAEQAADGGLDLPKIQIGGGEERMTWYGGTHELGRRIGKLLEQIVF